MDAPQKTRTVIIISLITIVAAVVIMLGWIFNIRVLQAIVPGFEPMRFNTALCFVLFGSALLNTQYQTRKYNSPLFIILSLLGTAIAMVTLFEDVFHFNTGLDELFVKDWVIPSDNYSFPGRMAFNAALSFVLLGLGFLALITKNRLVYFVAQCFFHLTTVISGIALIGYLYGVSLFYTLFYVSSMATHTAILLFIMSLAASLLNPSLGITRLFTGKLVGNQMAKRLFTLMILMVIIFGSFRVQTQRFQIFTLDIGVSLLAVCFLVVCLALIWNTANWLNKIDEQRSVAEAEVKLMNAGLEKRVAERTAEFQQSEEKYHSLIEQASDAIYVLSFNGDFTDVNASMCKMMGYSRDELLQLNVSAIIDPDELKTDPLPKSLSNPSQSVVRERRFINKNGKVFTVEVNVKRFADDRILVIARDITGRKKMEAELKEAELKFRTIAEKSMVGVYIVQGGKFVYANPRFAEVFGYEPVEVMNTFDVEAVIDEEYRWITTANVKKRMTGEVDSIHYEVKGLKKDGTNNWVEFYGSRATLGGEPAIIGSMIDITERKRTEDELRSSENKYKFLFESNPSPLWMIAKDDLSVIAVNQAAADLYGYTRDELLKMKVTAFRPDEDLELQLERYKRELGGAIDTGVVRHVKKDGSVMFVQIIAQDIIFDGRAVRLSLTNDITKRLKAEESLRKSEANLQTILNTTDTAYALFGTDLKVQAFNQKAIEFVKEQYNHVPGKGDSLADYFPADRFPQFIDFAKEVLQGNNINYEIDYRQADGSVIWYYVRLFPITNDNREILGLMMALYDITERKNAEQDLKSAYERIQSQIKSIKDMAWKQSHLVRSPLANLKALTSMMKEHPTDVEVLQHFQTELDRLDDIVHEIAKDASGHDE